MPTIAEAEARIAQLEAELKAAKAVKRATLSFKVSEKGAVSVYGLQRFPITLYANQWERLIAATPELQVFMENNRSSLSVKE